MHFELRWTREDEKKQPLMWTKQTCVPIGTIHIRRFHHDRCCAQATKTKQIQFFFPLKITFCCVWALEIYSLFALWKRIYRSICLMWFCFIRLCIFSFDFGVFFRFDKSHFAYMILHTYDSWHSFKCWFIQIFHMDVDRTIYKEWEREWMKVRQRGRGKENERHTVKYKYERCASSSMLSKYHGFSLGFIALDLSNLFVCTPF